MYYSYTEGNGPWHIWGERAERPATRPSRARVPGDDRQVRVWAMGDLNRVEFGVDGPKCDGVFYSDRLQQWNREKHDAAAEKHFRGSGQSWWTLGPEVTSAFLSDYFDRPCKCVALWQGNNAASGFPYWVFFVRWLGPKNTSATDQPTAE